MIAGMNHNSGQAIDQKDCFGTYSHSIKSINPMLGTIIGCYLIDANNKLSIQHLLYELIHTFRLTTKYLICTLNISLRTLQQWQSGKVSTPIFKYYYRVYALHHLIKDLNRSEIYERIQQEKLEMDKVLN